MSESLMEAAERAGVWSEPNDRVLDRVAMAAVERAVTGSHRTVLRPHRVFVAGGGVLTLAMRGFSRELLDLKRRLGSIPGLAAENPGSRWAKVTLAALRDDRPLTATEAERLLDVCLRLDAELVRLTSPLAVDALTIVVFDQRSLEQRAFSHRVDLEAAPADSAAARDEVPAEHSADVDEILSPFSVDLLESYRDQLCTSGHSLARYRAPWRESTLVFELAEPRSRALEGIRNSVETVLPDRYQWFQQGSLHVTIRALAPVETGQSFTELTNLLVGCLPCAIAPLRG